MSRAGDDCGRGESRGPVLSRGMWGALVMPPVGRNTELYRLCFREYMLLHLRDIAHGDVGEH
jgi:hypothetical protein